MRSQPTPPPSFVKDLEAYDPSLRVVWGPHTERWMIERRLAPRNPAWLAERPLNPFGRGPRAKDLWASWRQGYVNVLFVDPALLHWSLVAPELAKIDFERAGSIEALNRRLEEADAELERSQQRTVETWSQARAGEAADSLMWGEGHRQATPHEPSGVVSSDAVEQHDGFTVRVRKGAHA